MDAGLSDNLREHPAVQDVVAFAGFDLLAGTQKSSAGVAFVTLKDWGEREDPSLDARNLAGPFMGMNAGIKDGMVLAFNPPPIQGLSTTGGFDLFVQDRREPAAAGADRGDQCAGRGGAPSGPSWPACAPPSRPTSRSTRSTSTA